MAYPVCSFQANSMQNLSFENRIWLYWPCVYFLSNVCTCCTLGAIKEKNIIVWYFSFFTVILFFFYQRLTSSHSLPQDKALQIHTYETDQLITNGWVQTTCLVQRILVLNIFASLTYAYYYLMNLRKKNLWILKEHKNFIYLWKFKPDIPNGFGEILFEKSQILYWECIAH